MTPKRVVVWGTGFVGQMVIPEIVKHPGFELVGVGVSNPDKVGQDAGEICGIGPIGITSSIETPRIRSQPAACRRTFQNATTASATAVQVR